MLKGQGCVDVCRMPSYGIRDCIKVLRIIYRGLDDLYKGFCCVEGSGMCGRVWDAKLWNQRLHKVIGECQKGLGNYLKGLEWFEKGILPCGRVRGVRT